MRIISGTARGCKLAEFAVDAIRPTSDRVREAVFSIIISRLGNLSERVVLDLFAGTGAMGLEALSRGAAAVTFIDQSAKSIGLIRKNAETTRLTENAEILQTEVRQGIANRPGPFDIVFIDPPYRNLDITDILLLLSEQNSLKPDGLLCVETAHTTPLPDRVATLVQFDRRKYGSTAISLYEYGDLE